MSFVLLHGFAGHPTALQPLARELGGPGPFVPLLAGHADAPHASVDSHAFEREVDRLAGLIARRSRDKVALVGYSLGARLALALALRHPDLLRSLALLGVNPGLEDDGERSARKQTDERWAALLERDGMLVFADAWERQPLFHGRTICEPLRALRRAHEPKRLAAAMRGLGLANMPNYWPRLPELRVATSVLVGAQDSKFVALGRAIKARAPLIHVFVVEGSAHDISLEQPRAVSRIITRHDTDQGDSHE